MPHLRPAPLCAEDVLCQAVVSEMERPHHDATWAPRARGFGPLAVKPEALTRGATRYRLGRIVGLAVCCGCGCGVAACGGKTSPASTAGEHAGARTIDGSIAQRILVIDGHVDLPMRLDRSRRPDGSLGEDVGQETTAGDFDFVRAKRGGLDAPFMSIYVEPWRVQDGSARATADRRIDIVEGLIRAAPTRFAPARTPSELMRNYAEGRISLPMGMENASGLGADDEASLRLSLEHFYDRGVRYITLAHTEDNAFADSSASESPTHGGLTPLGRAAIHEMNRLGIIVDVSHVSDDAFWQVLQVSQKPVIASHSGCRRFTPGYARNLSDAMIKALAQQGGIVMVPFGSAFLDADAQRDRYAYLRARTAFMREEGVVDEGDPRVAAFSVAYTRKHPMRRASVQDVARHIDHIIRLVGADHVGLGSDFEGVGDSLATGLRDAADLPALFAALEALGHDARTLRNVASENFLRVWRAVEATSPEITQRPLPVTAERVSLTEAYRAQHYGDTAPSMSIAPQAIILHWTALGTFAESYARFAPIRLPSDRAGIAAGGDLNVSAHFLVDRDGSIHQLLPEHWMARHAIGLNHVAIGIENVGGVDGKPDLTPTQARSNALLIRELVRRYPRIQVLAGHHEVQSLANHPLFLERNVAYTSTKQDPGDAFMADVAALLDAWGVPPLRPSPPQDRDN